MKSEYGLKGDNSYGKNTYNCIIFLACMTLSHILSFFCFLIFKGIGLDDFLKVFFSILILNSVMTSLNFNHSPIQPKFNWALSQVLKIRK